MRRARLERLSMPALSVVWMLLSTALAPAAHAATADSTSAAKKPSGATKSSSKSSTSKSKKSTSSSKGKPAATATSKSAPDSSAKPAPSQAAAARPAPAAPSFAPIAEFTALSPGELLSLRFKLTRLGGVDPANAVALCSVTGTVAAAGDFAPYRRPGYQYEPAGSMPFNFNVESAQMQAVVDSVGTLPQVARGAAETHGVLSFAMLVSANGKTRAFEAVVNQPEARELMGRLLGALGPNISAVSSLRRFGCAGDLLPEGAPMSADSLVKLTLTGIRADKASPGEFMTEAVITNVSNHAIAGPLTLVVRVDSGTRLIGAEGQTCRVQPAGSPFVDLDGPGLEAGGTIRQALRFWNQSGNRFDVSVALLAGPGTR